MEYRKVQLNGNKYRLDVYLENVKIGSIYDTCCATILNIIGLGGHITVDYKPASGGFLMNNERVDLIQLFFEYAYNSPSLREYLKRRSIFLKNHELGNTLALKLFER